jgi:hypothetical protein
MTNEEYSLLFHRAQVNLVAFKQVYHCDDELRKMVEMAVADEREACAKMAEDLNEIGHSYGLEDHIRARGQA